MLTYLPMLVLLLLFGVVAVLGWVDRRRERPPADLPPLSFIVPCYNDADSVGETLKSIYEVCGEAGPDVLVIDDGSTDGSRERLSALKKRYGFTLILNPSNLGKSKALNTHFHRTRNDRVVLVDADVIVNRRALADAVTRLRRPDVGAVSCPYRAANPGFIPLMQTIEYNMLAFIQGAYNVFSAIALWGGFIAVRREAFLMAGGFTLNAITEDMDLAFKLNRRGWRVEQSFHPVRTFVPDTLRKWLRQKMRWSAGGFQCFLQYHRVWLKNPLHILFVFSFCLLLILSTFKLGKGLFLLEDAVRLFVGMQETLGVWPSLKAIRMVFGDWMLRDTIWRMAFTLFSLPFVLPLASTLRQMPVCLLVFPFSMIYIPLFSLISLAGAVDFLRKRRRLRTAVRAW